MAHCIKLQKVRIINGALVLLSTTWKAKLIKIIIIIINNYDDNSILSKLASLMEQLSNGSPLS